MKTTGATSARACLCTTDCRADLCPCPCHGKPCKDTTQDTTQKDYDYIAFVYSQGFRDGQESVIQIIEEMRYPEEHLGTANIKPTEMYERGFNSAISQIQNKLK